MMFQKIICHHSAMRYQNLNETCSIFVYSISILVSPVNTLYKYHCYFYRGEEAQIIDYQTQQYRLFPLLATSYAMYFAGRFMYDFYLKTTAEIEGGNLDSMPQVCSD